MCVFERTNPCSLLTAEHFRVESTMVGVVVVVVSHEDASIRQVRKLGYFRSVPRAAGPLPPPSPPTVTVTHPAWQAVRPCQHNHSLTPPPPPPPPPPQQQQQQQQQQPALLRSMQYR